MAAPVPGLCCWAKMPRFCFWPAVVLGRDKIPAVIAGDEKPGLTPVRFFGTYDYAWVPTSNNLLPFEAAFKDKQDSSRSKLFVKAKAEAKVYLENGTVPEPFLHMPVDDVLELGSKDEDELAADVPELQEAGSGTKKRRAPRNSSGAANGSASKKKGAGSGLKIRLVETPEQRMVRMARRARRLRIMRQLALIAPEDATSYD